jgi:hypothetical protein
MQENVGSREPVIMKRVMQMKDTITALEETISRVGSRLDKLMMPEVPSLNEKISKELQPEPEFACMLADITTRIRNCTSTVESIFQRLEI